MSTLESFMGGRKVNSHMIGENMILTAEHLYSQGFYLEVLCLSTDVNFAENILELTNVERKTIYHLKRGQAGSQLAIGVLNRTFRGSPVAYNT